ncbi:sodium:solute symporter family protein [Portibacter lacus]|uniref:Cation acetate symporter n=1 Tax=Portibacter lacus TaxID=1099794 RepID=A0AA37SLU6_9BACT|nr:sodium:solute symporter family protein [Portibacter lacus]GLR15742.1 cation acetate symporter [Portibacter lacus]
MNIETWSYLIVGLTFALYIGIAIWARAGSTKEFYVAGGGVHPILNGMATAADWMSAASFLSMAGLISFMGYDGAQYLLGWTGGYVLLALLLAPYLRKFGQFTVPDFIGERYYTQTARLVAVICALFVSFTYVVGQMKGVGVAFSRFLGVEFGTGVIIGVAIVFFYAVLGGMKGITYTQVAQFCVLTFAFTVPAVFVSIQMVDNPIPQLGMGGAMSDGTAMLAKLNQLSIDLGFNEYTSPNKPRIDLFCVTAALMLGTAGLPHVIVRFFTVPKVRDARKSAGWALLFIAILYTTAPAVAVFARTNVITSIDNVEYAEVPGWFKSWEETGLLKFEDKNEDGRIQYYNDKNENFVNTVATEKGWKGNELVTFDRDIIVLASPEIAKLPAWVIALMVAGGLAAALSTAAGLLLVISSSISHDLLKKWLMPNISEKGELRAARISIAVAVVVAGIAGYNPPDYVAAIVAFAFGLAASSFFPAIILGIFDKRMNMQGAVTGMIIGLVFTATYIIYFKFGGGTPDQYFLQISPEGIGTVGMLLNLVISLIVSRVTPPPPESVQEMVESIRIPRGAGAAQEH